MELAPRDGVDGTPSEEESGGCVHERAKKSNDKQKSDSRFPSPPVRSYGIGLSTRFPGVGAILFEFSERASFGDTALHSTQHVRSSAEGGVLGPSEPIRTEEMGKEAAGSDQ